VSGDDGDVRAGVSVEQFGLLFERFLETVVHELQRGPRCVERRRW
jgi:hypothetical protein